MIELQPFTDEREWTVDDIPVLTAAVSVPQAVSGSQSVTRRIQKYYRAQSQAYFRYCETWLLPPARAEYHSALAASAPLPHFRAELTYRITYQQASLLSLYTQSLETTTQRFLSRRGDTWDLSTGYPIPLSDFFPPHSPWKQSLMKTVAASIQRQEEEGAAQYAQHSPRALRRQFNPMNYYLTEEGVAIFFPMYSIAPPMEGIPTFLIPYGEGLAPSLPTETAPKKAPEL